MSAVESGKLPDPIATLDCICRTLIADPAFRFSQIDNFVREGWPSSQRLYVTVLMIATFHLFGRFWEQLQRTQLLRDQLEQRLGVINIDPE